MTTLADLHVEAARVVAVALLAEHAALNTAPTLDPPTIAYATAEMRNAADRLRMAITQLETR